MTPELWEAYRKVCTENGFKPMGGYYPEPFDDHLRFSMFLLARIDEMAQRIAQLENLLVSATLPADGRKADAAWLDPATGQHLQSIRLVTAEAN